MTIRANFSRRPLGDINADGILDLAVGADGDDDGGYIHGSTWILFLDVDGTVKGQQKISDLVGGFAGTLQDADYFGRSLAWLGDMNGDGAGDLAVGAHRDDDGGNPPDADRGAIWILFLDGAYQARVTSRNAGLNPESQTTLTRPRLDKTYTIEVDLAGTTGHALAVLYGYHGGLTFTLGGGQCVLVDFLDPNGELLGTPNGSAPTATFDLPVPNDIALVGFELTTQGAHVLGVHPFALSNALDAIIGY